MDTTKGRVMSHHGGGCWKLWIRLTEFYLCSLTWVAASPHHCCMGCWGVERKCRRIIQCLPSDVSIRVATGRIWLSQIQGYGPHSHLERGAPNRAEWHHSSIPVQLKLLKWQPVIATTIQQQPKNN